MPTATPTATRVQDVMTRNPITLETSSTVSDAAKAMAGADIGPVPVIDAKGELCGLLTDRDIAVRVVAEGRDPNTTKVIDVATTKVTTLKPTDSVDAAIKKMANGALRRIPIVDKKQVVGIVSLGDLARMRDPKSVLADISSAPPST